MKAAMVRRNVLTVVGAAAMGLAMVMPALAVQDAEDATTAVVNPGTLDITAITAGDFEAKNITGRAQTTDASLSTYTVTDFRGNGGGWSLTAQATPFRDDVKDLDLAGSSLKMTAPSVTPVQTGSTPPTVQAGPFTIDVASPVQFAQAAPNTGMGEYAFGATTLTLSLPADVFAGTYTSDLTVSVVAAP